MSDHDDSQTPASTTSPRTDAAPMAFTAREFLAGAARACGIFTVLNLVLSLGYGSMILFVAPLALLWTAVALIVFGPVAYVLGHVLRTVPRVGVHLACFAALGVVIGIATTWAAAALTFGVSGGPVPLLFLAPVVSAAVAVPLAWWLTARKALRA